MNRLMQDVSYALRQLRKSPGFTITAVLTLALGIGANAAIFTLVHAVLLRNLPVADPAQLVRVGDTDDCCVEGGAPKDNDYSIFAYDLYLHLRDTTPEFEQMAAMQAGGNGGSLTVRTSRPDSTAKSANGEFVSGNYFLTLGLNPGLGRLMVPADDAPNAPMVAVLNYQTWLRDYGADPSVVGSVFSLNTHPVTVIGITPAGFYGDRVASRPSDFYVPMSMEPILSPTSNLHRESTNWVYILGRVKPGTQLAPLQAQMSASLRNWLAHIDTYAKANRKKGLAASHVILTPGGVGIANMQKQYSSGLYLLMGISGLVLLIACANIANLVLVRGMGRRSETSLRMAMGAQRTRIIRQMLTESIVLSCCGGLAGLAVAYGGTRLLLALAFPSSPSVPIHASPSPIVLAFSFGLSLLTGLIFGITPAWITSHAEPAEALRGSSRSTKDGSSLLQRSLVVLQAALSLVLLVGAGLISKSLSKLENQNFGLKTENRVVIHVTPENAGYKPEQLQALYDQLTQKFHAIPGVEHVSLSLYTPLEGNNWGEGVYLQGRPEPGPDDKIGASWLRVSPEYFDMVGHKLLRGRGITAQDTATSPGIAVVNQAFVKKFFPNGDDPIGKQFGTMGQVSSSDMQIVGLVSDVKYNDPRGEMTPMYFRPLLQAQKTQPAQDIRSMYIGAIMLQTKGPVTGLEAQTRRALAEINPNLTEAQYDTFADQIGGQFDQDRLIARLTQIFGVLALALAAIGLYGVTAYTVARRTSEIGIRMALGAARGSVVNMVLREAMVQAAVGLAIGIPVALLCGRFLKTQLFGVDDKDVPTLLLATLALVIAAFVAGLIPARRAASIDPMVALRTE